MIKDKENKDTSKEGVEKVEKNEDSKNKVEEPKVQLNKSEFEELITKALDKQKEEISKNTNPFNINIAPSARKLEKGNIVGAWANTVIKSKLRGESLKKTAEWLKEKSNTEASEIIYKGVNESDFSEGGALAVPTEVANEFINVIRAKNVIRQLPVTNIQMTKDTMTYKRMDSGTNAYWVGETDISDASESSPSFGQYVLSPHKLFSYVNISNDMLDDVGSNVETILQNDIASAIAQKEELAFLHGTGTEYTPKGLYYWTADGNIETQTGTTAANIETDLLQMLENIKGNNIPGNDLYWLMPYRPYKSMYTKTRAGSGAIAWPELRGSEPSLLGYPVKITNNIPTNLGDGGDETRIYLLAASEFVVADRKGVSFRINPPHNDSNITQSIEETLVVCESRVDTLLKHDEACTILTEVTY